MCFCSVFDYDNRLAVPKYGRSNDTTMPVTGRAVLGQLFFLFHSCFIPVRCCKLPQHVQVAGSSREQPKEEVFAYLLTSLEC